MLAGLATTAVICTAVLGGAVQAQAATTGPAVHAPVAAQHMSGRIHLTAAQEAAWRRDTATPAGRERVLSAFQAAFGNIAEVGTGKVARYIPGTRARGPMRPDLSYGITGDHFWIIASYADIADGAINVAVAVCRARVTPAAAPVCNAAGAVLKAWAAGWGTGNSHGVWAAIYWWPPHYTGGRW